MGLKSYDQIRIKKRPRMKRGRFRTGTRDMVTGGVTALIGIGLLSQTASAVSKI